MEIATGNPTLDDRVKTETGHWPFDVMPYDEWSTVVKKLMIALLAAERRIAALERRNTELEEKT